MRKKTSRVENNTGIFEADNKLVLLNVAYRKVKRNKTSKNLIKALIQKILNFQKQLLHDKNIVLFIIVLVS